ncbi:MAG: ABC transporter permease subunit [Candidatus Poseidoniales archaeon]
MKLWIYVVRRLALTIPVLLGVTLITFYLSYGMGDPLAPYVTEKTTPEQYAELIDKHNLDEPIQYQYVTYLRNIITFEWGYSKVINQDVSEAMPEKFAATLELSILAFIVSVATAIPLGIFSSIRQNRWHDHSIRLFALFGSAIPIFWFALFLQYIVAFKMDLLPLSLRYDPILWEITDPIDIETNFLLIDAIAAGSLPHFIDALKHMILPATVLAYGSMATIIRLMRGNMLDVLGQDYIRTAKSKGLTEKQVTFEHGAPNAMIPTVTLLGMGFAGLINGSVLTETIFTWPGLGAWAITAMRSLDVSAILAYTLFSAFLYIIANLIVDILYAFLDPRVELGGHLSIGEIIVVSFSVLLLLITFVDISIAVLFTSLILVSLVLLLLYSVAIRLIQNPEDLLLVGLFFGTLFVVWSILTGFFMILLLASLLGYSVYVLYNWNEIKDGLAPKYDELKRAAYQIRRNPLTILGLFLVISLLSIALFAPFLAPPSDNQRDVMSMEEHFEFNYDHQPPCYFSCTAESGEKDGYILGSTDRGYDIYYGIVWGSRTSLDVAVKVVITGTFIAAIIGAVSGYYGGKADDVIMRITDVFIAIPGLVLALAIIAVTGDNSIEMLMYALIIVWWPGFTRVIRAEALRIRKLPYIEAAKAAGASDFRIIFKHVLPNCITSIIVIATMDMGGIVLSLAALGFLGFGGGADLAEWGKLVSFGQDDMLKGEWWGFFFPGLAVALWAFGFYLLGDGVRDILDPKQRN